MGRTVNIIARVRDSLSDPSGDRWTDERLLRLLDEAQKEIVLSAKLLRTKSQIEAIPDQAVYDVPTDCYKIIRALYDGIAIAFISHEGMDELLDDGIIPVDTKEGWEAAEGDPAVKLVYDKLNPGKIKLYPIPTEVTSADLSSIYGVVADVGDDTIMNTPYGVVVGFDSNFDNQIVDENGDPTTLGVLTYLNDSYSVLTLYYLKRPIEITGASLGEANDPEIDQVWDTALKHYVTGMALRDDKDTQSRSMGTEELQLFASSVREATKDAAQDFLSVRTHLRASYNNGFDL